MEATKNILSIETKVLKVLGSQINLPTTGKIIYKKLKEDLGLKARKMNAVIVMLEKLYRTPIPPEDIEQFNTPDDIIQFIEKKQQKQYVVKLYKRLLSKKNEKK